MPEFDRPRPDIPASGTPSAVPPGPPLVPRSPVTLEDVAAEAGFDKSTVSIVLRDHPRAARFADATRRRIRAAAERLGYRPNFFAQQLSGQRPRLLLLAVGTLDDPLAMAVADGFERRAAELGQRVLITALRRRPDPLELYRDLLGPRGVPAVALIGPDAALLPDATLLRLAGEGVRVVLVDRPVPDGGDAIGHVGTDDAAGGRLAATHVYDQGARDVWALVDPTDPASARRARGYAEAAATYGLPAPRTIACDVDNAADTKADAAATAVTRELAAGRPVPQALLAVSDALAAGACRALLARGLRPGRDVAVVGYDDGPLARVAWPPRTTVRRPTHDLGRAAVDALTAMLAHPDAAVPRVVLPVTLVERDSGRYHGTTV